METSDLARVVVIINSNALPQKGSTLELLRTNELDLGVTYSVLDLKEDGSIDGKVDFADLIISSEVSLCTSPAIMDTPVFLLVSDTTKEGDYIAQGAADIMSDTVDPRLLYRRVDNLLERMNLHHKLKSRAPLQRQRSSSTLKARRPSETAISNETALARKTVFGALQEAIGKHVNTFARKFDGQDKLYESRPMSSGVNPDIDHAFKAVSSQEGFSNNLAGDEDADVEGRSPSMRNILDIANDDNELDLLTKDTEYELGPARSFGASSSCSSVDSGHIPSHPAETELDYLRRRSVKLSYQLSLQKAETKRLLRTEEMVQKFRSDLGRVSDLLNDYESNTVETTGKSKTEAQYLYSTIREIQRVVAKQHGTFEDVEVDTSTKKWLDSTFYTQETGIELSKDENEPDRDDNSHKTASTINEEESKTQTDSSVYSATGRRSPMASPLSPMSPHSPGGFLPVKEHEVGFAENTRPLSPGSCSLTTILHRSSVHTCTMRWTKVFRAAGQDALREHAASSPLAIKDLSQSESCRSSLAQTFVEAVIRCEDEWDVWKLGEIHMMADAYEMLQQFGMTDIFGVRQTSFKSFFTFLSNGYRAKNPYHNLFHGYDVMKTTFFLLEVCGLAQGLPNLSGYSVLVAALGHDVGHPGLNNVFQIKASTDLALRYNDNSVLENYHAAIVFRCFRKGNDEMYGNLDLVGRREMRKIIVESILATDVSKHVKMLKVVNEGSTDHLLQLKLLLCVADVSNPFKPTRIAASWTNRVNEEFFLQGDEERRRRMEISPYCDRQQGVSAKASLNFINFIVNPVLEAAKSMFPTHETNMQVLLDVLGEEIARLKALMHEETRGHNNPDLADTRLQEVSEGVETSQHRPLRSSRSPPPSIVRSVKKLPPIKSLSPQLGLDGKKRKELQRRLEAAYGQPMP